MTSNSKLPSPDKNKTFPNEDEIEKGLRVIEIQNLVLKRILEEKEKNQDFSKNPASTKKKNQQK
jgi:hypothetical protein